MWLYYFVATLYVITCLVLMLVVLIQQGKAGDMASAFGGGSSQAAFGARAGATLLSQLTTAFAVLFMLGALGLAIMGQRGTGSVLSGSAPPPPPAAVPLAPTPAGQTAPPAPTTPAPAAPAAPT